MPSRYSGGPASLAAQVTLGVSILHLPCGDLWAGCWHALRRLDKDSLTGSTAYSPLQKGLAQATASPFHAAARSRLDPSEKTRKHGLASCVSFLHAMQAWSCEPCSPCMMLSADLHGGDATLADFLQQTSLTAGFELEQVLSAMLAC